MLVGIGKAMEEHCPDAWLFNITNPMTALTRVRVPGDRHQDRRASATRWGTSAWTWPSPWASPRGGVGLGDRHQPLPGADRARGRRRRRLRRVCATSSTRSGAWPSLAPHPGRPEAEKFSKLDFAQRHLFKLTLLDRWGTFPAAGDRHIAEFVSFALTPESDWGAAYNIELSPISRREEHQAEYIADVDAWLAGTKDLQTWQSGELPSPDDPGHAHRRARSRPRSTSPTRARPSSLPADVVLESICVIDGDGIRGRDRSALPPPYDEIVRRHVATQELTVEAALRGDRTLAGEAFALDPLAGRGDLRDDRTPWWTSCSPARRSGCRSSHSAEPDRSGGTRMRIGFIGLGAMGLPMAGHLVAAGHDVTVASRSRGPIEAAVVAQGATDGGSPPGVAEASEVVVLCVPNSPEVVEVVDAMLPRWARARRSWTARPSTPRWSGPSTPGWARPGRATSTRRSREAPPARTRARSH